MAEAITAGELGETRRPIIVTRMNGDELPMDIDVDTAVGQFMTAIKQAWNVPITFYSEERTRVGQLLAGRAAFRHVYQRFKLDRGMAMVIDVSMLVQLTFNGELETFLAIWDYTLMGLVKQPDDELMLCLLDTQLRKCKALGPAFVVYDGAQEGAKERSFQFLYNAARQEVLRNQREAT